MKRKSSVLLFTAIVTFAVNCSPISAQELPQVNKSRWWPGNPNPQSGSEVGIQNHMYIAAPSAKARTCGMQALIGTGLGSGLSAWLLKASLSAYSFGLTFGVGFIASYTVCVFWTDGDE